MTAQVLDFRPRGSAPTRATILEPRPTIVHGPAWWTCTSWCDRTCLGGYTYRSPDGWTNTIARVHNADTYRQTLTDVADGNEISLAATVAASEDLDDGYETPAVRLEVNDSYVSVTPDEAEEYALAVLAAVKLARQPLPQISRSPLHGGGRATNVRPFCENGRATNPATA